MAFDNCLTGFGSSGRSVTGLLHNEHEKVTRSHPMNEEKKLLPRLLFFSFSNCLSI